MVSLFIINWFIEHSSINKDEIDSAKLKNYLNEGLLDSLSFLELISKSEDYFNIKFTDEDFENEKFYTISGMIDIIEMKVNNGNKQ